MDGIFCGAFKEVGRYLRGDKCAHLDSGVNRQYWCLLRPAHSYSLIYAYTQRPVIYRMWQTGECVSVSNTEEYDCDSIPTKGNGRVHTGSTKLLT